MYYPKMITPNSRSTSIQTFGGLDRTPSADSNFFSDLCNTSSRCYPYLSTRKKRVILSNITERPSALYTVGGITYTVGNKVYFNNVLQSDKLSYSDRKTIVSMGGKIYIFPDAFFFNPISLDENGVSTEIGFLGNKFSLSSGTVTVIPCVLGEPIPKTVTSLPDTANEGDYCIDISALPSVLYRYSSSGQKWSSVPATHICLKSPFIDSNFSIGDCISVSGTPFIDGNYILSDTSADALVISGTTENVVDIFPSSDTPFSVTRSIPILDYVCEHNNRLWGCRYGTDNNGVFVNEIYASKLGDPKNWNVFSGISTDSYTASCGSDGPFTGIISHMGYVVFFKERMIHRLFGTKPSNFTLYEDRFNGVALNNENSLCMIGNTVFYNSSEGICIYSGSEPKIISKPLEQKNMRVISSAAYKNIYRFCCTEENNTVSNYVYDTEKNLWHKEDGESFLFMNSVGCNILALKKHGSVFNLELLDGNDIPENLAKLFPPTPLQEENFHWFAESNPINSFVSNSEFIKHLKIRLKLLKGSSLKIFIQTADSNVWRQCGALSRGHGVGSLLRINIPRCDRFKIKLSGYGECELYSVNATVEAASEVI